ncbi:MAG: hypothetical protein IT285_12180 [Bdellovibrionales bacterium]|nr:hypothetical protein [Bdellovibrionales bacterium]
MKRSALAALAVLTLGISGCNEVGQMTLVRTAETPMPIVKTADVPVYRTECRYTTVYGQHSSCGFHQVCRTYYNSEGQPYIRCRNVMNSCYHTVSTCFDVFSHTTRATLRLWFPDDAILLPGERELVDLSFSGRYTRKILQLGVRDSRYRYEFPAFHYVDMLGPTAELDVAFRVREVQEVRPANNVTIRSAEYVDGGNTLRVVFDDPYRSLNAVRESFYRFQVKRGLNTYIDATVRSSELQAEVGAPYVVEIRKGTPEWSRDPRAGKKHSFKWSVERDSDLFKERFSEKKALTIRF